MGVLGLWRLIDATGKPVPLETLEGKVLAVDVSIWIHQVIQGYQDRRGNSLPNAHLIGLFNRICKLMYFKIKPIFVFDGGVPLLKKNTIATRRKLKSIAATKAQKLKNDLINNLIKHTAVKGVLEGKNEGESSSPQKITDSVIAGPSKLQDIYKLPDLPSIAAALDPDDYINSEDEDDLEVSPRKQTKWMGNIHSVDISNEEFKQLPADVRYDILTDLKETRKHNSWGRIHELPTGSNKYSGFQVGRLLKRRNVQEELEAAEKEMGGKTLTLEELDRLLTDQGINTTQRQDSAFRIASDSTTRVIYLKDKPMSQNNENSNDSSKSKGSKTKSEESITNDGLIETLSSTSGGSVAVIDDINAYDLEDDWEEDEGLADITLNESQLLPKSVIPKSVMNPALSYMLENSGLSKEQILKIVEQSKKNKKKSDTASSTGSARRRSRGGRRSSLVNKSKKKKLFDSGILDSPKVKEEVLSDTESTNNADIVSTIGSGSESDDFVEVPDDFDGQEKKIEGKVSIRENISNKAAQNNRDPDCTITNASESDTESDDFIEIQDVPIPEFGDPVAKKDLFQIEIKTDQTLQDDIFADVFSDLGPIKKEEESFEDKPPLDSDIISKIIVKEKLSQIKPEDVSYKEDRVNGSKLETESFTLPMTPKKSTISSEKSVEKDISKGVEPETVLQKEVEKNEKLSITENREIIGDNETGDSEAASVADTEKSVIEIPEAKSNEDIEIGDDIIFDDDFDVDLTETERELPPLVLPSDERELESMKDQLETEQQQIAGSLGKLERQAIDITDQMRLEAQELLRLFGLPYMVAPMEAEAQCAYLEQIKFTDGTITDDSDIWLFGGHCVYKNFFDNNKKVLQFLSNDIQHHFKLSRNELIQLALLVGSDYTNGLAGVGPVTALEIISSFPNEGEDILRGLRSFCAWFRAGKLSAPGRSTLRNKLKNVQVERGFPSQAVVQAYLCPTVDESKDPFTWGKPNLVLLQDYVKKKFGWTKLKFEEILNPVLQRLNETKSQKGIDKYFKVYTVPKSIETTLSKRVQTAVQRLGGKSQDAELTDEEEASVSSQEKKGKRVKKPSTARAKKSKTDPNELSTIAEANEPQAGSSKSANDDEITPQVPENSFDLTNEDGSNLETSKQTTTKRIYKSIEERGKPQKIVRVNEVIPQRERDKLNALKTKLKAIEVFRKSKKGPGHVQKSKRVTKKIKDDAELSEDSSDSS